MDLVVIMVLLGLVVVFVSAPLRRVAPSVGLPPEMTTGDPEPELRELETARDAKLRELRDAELDHRTGKLSDQDYQALDASLRAEAIEILRSMDQARDHAEHPG
ncbi:MAG TPA: hypothetical protein VGF70_15100 [Solirubrobacteraceae bacterium]|jgi:hypothetical protein